MIVSQNFQQSSSRLAFSDWDWDYCRHNYCTFLHACPSLSQNFVFSSRFWTADHRWWSNWFLKTISRRFISQETEQKWLVRPPAAKRLDAKNSSPLWATGLGTDCFPPQPELWRLRDNGDIKTSHTTHLDMVMFYLIGLLMEYQFIILYLLSIWDKILNLVGLSSRPGQDCCVIKLNIFY